MSIKKYQGYRADSRIVLLAFTLSAPFPLTSVNILLIRSKGFRVISFFSVLPSNVAPLTDMGVEVLRGLSKRKGKESVD